MVIKISEYCNERKWTLRLCKNLWLLNYEQFGSNECMIRIYVAHRSYPSPSSGVIEIGEKLHQIAHY